ncbi:PDR/VanB family oxidoreductase [Rhodococcoides yunnanense]|uniref:PDR/VanB family oxidoreductase n=1 Tax=Rhodococcoides yunnanense TaxID=278209 RepID=UPI0009322B04|nr:PDR/VanB family oxidoreductase [Rhodococcus yunnanensis]
MASTETRYDTLRVTQAELVADAIVLARFESPTAAPLPPWEPGSHIEIVLPSGLVRHYSLCSDPDDPSHYEIAVLREPAGRGGSAEFHDGVSVGSDISVGLPRNNFTLEPATEYLFIAGGVGITPMLPMIRRADATGTPWRLVYGGRTRASMAFLDSVVALGSDRVSVFADDVEGRPNFAAEMGRLGAGAAVYACGPTPMLDLLTELHITQGVAAELHIERFVGESAGDITGETFEVVATRSGVSVTVGTDESILTALRPLVSHIPFSCEDGYCGTCETAVIEGTVDHRDSYLDDDERAAGDTMMICVSRCTGSRLVLDL